MKTPQIPAPWSQHGQTATKATHTPAPWTFEAPSTVLIPVYNDKAGAEPIRLMLQTKAGEAKANARLIAAAPELLEALQGARSALRKALPFLPADNEAVYCGEWLDEINEAIQKATG